MKRLLCNGFIFLSLCSSVMAQDTTTTIGVGSPAINRDYLVPHSVFLRLSWIDAAGHLVRSATLNCITRIDSVNKNLTYLQLRNDGKRDSTVAHWPDLKPMYTSSMGGSRTDTYDFRAGKVKITSTDNGKVLADSTAALSPSSFDSYLTDYLIGALPLKPGFSARFTANSGSVSTLWLKDVYTDVVFGPSGQPVESWLVRAEVNNYKVLYWVDKATHDMLKVVWQIPDGGIFMKSKI